MRGSLAYCALQPPGSLPTATLGPPSPQCHVSRAGCPPGRHRGPDHRPGHQQLLRTLVACTGYPMAHPPPHVESDRNTR